MRYLLMLLVLFALPVMAQDDGAVLVGSFNYDTLPYRDLAVSCGDGVFLFGDTFDAISPQAIGWRPNTAARLVNGRLTALNGDNTLWTAGADAEAAAQALTPPRHGVSMPSGCTTYDGAYVAFYTDASYNTGHDFTAVSSGVAVSYDGAQWTKYRLFEGDGGRAQAAFAQTGDGYLYAFMTGAGRVGAATLARTTDPTNAAAWAWWDGASWGAWESAATVIDGTVGEMSVCYDGGQWRAAYLDPAYNGVIERTSPALTGQWSEARMLVSWEFVHGSYAPQWMDCGQTFLLSHFEAQVIGGVYRHAYNVYLWSIG